MSALTLRLRESMPAAIDVSHLVPERLAELGVGRIAELPLWCGSERLRVDEVFEVSGDDTESLVFEADAPTLQGVGYRMARGTITVNGPTGAYCGWKMRGGKLTVRGDAGAYAASGMRGGLLSVEGNAGDFLAAARPGERYGMEGGVVLVRGNAGVRVGERMRRGSVLVEGSVADWCAARMRAGTIGVLGDTGAGLGWGMRRGTILLAQPPDLLSPLFRENGEQRLSFLALLARSLESLQTPFTDLLRATATVRRYVGDRSVAGIGELLLLDGKSLS